MLIGLPCCHFGGTREYFQVGKTQESCPARLLFLFLLLEGSKAPSNSRSITQSWTAKTGRYKFDEVLKSSCTSSVLSIFGLGSLGGIRTPRPLEEGPILASVFLYFLKRLNQLPIQVYYKVLNFPLGD